MRHIIFLLTISVFLASCGQNETKRKELELKERELALKEKEFALKQKDSTITSSNSVISSRTIKNTTSSTTINNHAEPSNITNFWTLFKIAYTKKDNNALTNLLELPIRENMSGTQYGDNPSLNLSTFLVEAKDLHEYNLEKSTPILKQELKKYASFEGYKFNPTDQIYEVKLERNITDASGYAMALYIKANNGVFKLFAFEPEISFNYYGD